MCRDDRTSAYEHLQDMSTPELVLPQTPHSVDILQRLNDTEQYSIRNSIRISDVFLKKARRP